MDRRKLTGYERGWRRECRRCGARRLGWAKEQPTHACKAWDRLYRLRDRQQMLSHISLHIHLKKKGPDMEHKYRTQHMHDTHEHSGGLRRLHSRED